MELTEIFDSVIDISGSFLLKNNGLEVTKPIFLSAVKSAIRIYNRYKPYVRYHTDISIGEELKYTFTDSTIYPIPKEVSVALPTSGLTGFFPADYFRDRFRYEMVKREIPIKYIPPTLYVPFASYYNFETVNFYRVREQVAVQGLGTYTEKEVGIHLNSPAMSVAGYLNTIINTISGFSCQIVDSVFIQITNSVNGAPAVIPSIGTTGWDDPEIVQQGDVTHPHIVKIHCESDLTYSLLAKYLILSTPTVTYYFWFNINSNAKDITLDWYFVDHISDTDNTDYFFKLCIAFFKQMLGGSRSMFTLDNMPIKNNGDTLLRDGKSEEEAIIKYLVDDSDASLAW